MRTSAFTQCMRTSAFTQAPNMLFTSRCSQQYNYTEVKAVLQDTKWMLLLNDDISETYHSRAIPECSAKRLSKFLGEECTTPDATVTPGFAWTALSPIFEMVAGDQEVGLVIEDEEEDALMEIMTNKYSRERI